MVIYSDTSAILKVSAHMSTLLIISLLMLKPIYFCKSGTLMSIEYVAVSASTKISDAMRQLQTSDIKHKMISYMYIVTPPENTLIGVVDLQEMVLSKEDTLLSDIRVAQVISTEETDVKDDIVELFAKYHFRMIPVVDPKDHLLGVIHHNGTMKGLLTRVRP
jgi:Mg/Co/Ni transporter MgtE